MGYIKNSYAPELLQLNPTNGIVLETYLPEFVMVSLFSKPKTPDTSKQVARLEAQDAELKARELQTQQQATAAQRARAGRRAAGASLITSGNETGVAARPLLG